MIGLYRIGIWAYVLIVWLIRPVNPKAKKFIDGRKKWSVKLENDLKSRKAPVIWFHAASLGEFEQGRPVMEALKKAHHVQILLTFFSPSGYEVRKNYAGADWVHYLPIDTKKNASRFMQIVQPVLAIFIKYEFWYFMLKELQNRQVRTLMIACLFRPNQLFFHWSGKFYQPVLRGIAHYFMQDQQSLDLGKSIGIPEAHLTLAGDTRFDRVLEISSQSKIIEVIEKFKKGPLMVLGSTWPSDMQILKPVIDDFYDRVQFVVAPHNLLENEIQELVHTLPESILFSDTENLADRHRVLIIDNMGMLSSVYRYGMAAYVGGGLRGALHNTLEAAVYGIPVIFGAHDKNDKFQEAMALLKAGGALEVHDCHEIGRELETWLTNEEERKSMGQRAGSFVLAHAGATEKIMALVEKFIK